MNTKDSKTIYHGTPFVETELILDALEANEESAKERLSEMTPTEIRELDEALDTLASWIVETRSNKTS